MNATTLQLFRCTINALGQDHEIVIQSTEYDAKRDAKTAACSLFNANGLGSSHAVILRDIRKTNKRVLAKATKPSAHGRSPVFRSLDSWCWIL